MKVAIVSFGHLDTIITLARYLSRYIEIDLYVLFAQSNKKDSILNFNNLIVNNGLLSSDFTSKILGKEIESYIGKKFNIYFFIYISYRTYYLKNMLLSYNFAKIIKERKYDLVHFNGNNLQQVLISFFTPGLPKVHSIHDYRGHSGERNFWAESFNKSLVNSRRYKIMHSYFNLHQSAAQYNLEQKRIHIIPFGPLEIFQIWKDDSFREENNRILFFGRISPYKGIEYLVEATPIIKEKIPDLKIVLAGEGHYYFNIESLKKDNTYQIINRYITNQELAELIQKSCLVVCPYTDATQSSVIMTAHIFSKPVVATDVGGISEILEDAVTGRLVPAKNPQKLAEAIIHLLENPEERKTMSENIKKKFSEGRFSWDRIAQQTLEVYKEAIRHN